MDPRLVRSRGKVVDAALELLAESGAAGVSIEAVAARSGVAKSTIYRQYPDREALLFDAFEAFTGPPSVPMEADVVTDVEAWLQTVTAGFYDHEIGTILPVMIDAAERSERALECAKAFTARRRAALLARLQAAVDQGEIDPATDMDFLQSSIVGPVFYRRFISRQPTPPEFVSRLVATTLGPVLRRRP